MCKMDKYKFHQLNGDEQVSLINLMLNNTRDIIFLLDAERRFVIGTKDRLHKLGFNTSNIHNRDFLESSKEAMREDSYKRFSTHLLQVLNTGETNKYRAHITLKSGRICDHEVIMIPFINEGKEVVGAMVQVHDITEFQNAIDAAIHANKAKTSFLAAMSHEIRTPLNSIIGLAQISLQQNDLTNDIKDTLEKIHSSGNDLLRIINDILDMSKVENGKLVLNPEEYSLPSLIHDVMQLNAIRLDKKQLDFKLEINKNLPLSLLGDELRIKQIMNNLLSNAIKYTETGNITLKIRHKPIDSTTTYLIISIKDTGQGIKHEDLATIFSQYTRFNTGSNRYIEGTGLGLSITKRLVDMMDGEIELQSEYGKGSTFTAKIKQKTITQQTIGQKTAESLKSFTFKPKKHTAEMNICPLPHGKVLVVDDVEVNLNVAEAMLQLYELKVDTTTSGLGAIDLIKDNNTYDIIFMDHMMPNLDGIETTQKLRKMGYKKPIVALTANALTGDSEMFTENGFDNYISKPIDVRRLNEILLYYIQA